MDITINDMFLVFDQLSHYQYENLNDYAKYIIDLLSIEENCCCKQQYRCD